MRPVVLALTLALALVGCLGGAGNLGDPRTVTASTGARVSETWAYSGEGVAAADATFTGTFNDAENTGSATITFNLGGQSFNVTFDKFAQAEGKTFMDGGIEFDLTEHGDTGVADASIPKVLALVAAWGEGSLVVDGTPLADPNTGGPTWVVHVMASDTTVRGVDGRITKADGTTPYDPATPADARRVEGDRQLLAAIRAHPHTGGVEPVNETFTGSGPSPGGESFTFHAHPGGIGTFAITASGVAGPVGVGQLDVRLIDPEGTEITQAQVAVAPNGENAAQATFVTVLDGEYSIVATAQGAFSYEILTEVTYGPDRFIAITWDDFDVSG